MGRNPDDRDDDLHGNDDVSRAYQRLKTPPLPRDIDAIIQRQARAALEENPQSNESHEPRARGSQHRPLTAAPVYPRRPRWFAPFALAASVLLSVAVVTAVVFQPGTRPRHEESPRLILAAAHDADRLSLRDAQARSRDHGADMAQPKDPQSWLARIRELRKSGRHREADAEYLRFRGAYPNYVMDAEDAAIR